MTDGNAKAREISLGDGFGKVAVSVNGVLVEVHTDRSVDAYTNGPVKVHSPPNARPLLTCKKAFDIPPP